jgi:hypothetical protein
MYRFGGSETHPYSIASGKTSKERRSLASLFANVLNCLIPYP